MSRLEIAKIKGSISADLKRIERTGLPILDDFAMQVFDSGAGGIRMDIVGGRYQKRSTVIASQMPVKGGQDASSEKTIADAVLDRLVHHALRVERYGDSARKEKEKNENGCQ
jgi:DNA replication protein DnaC